MFNLETDLSGVSEPTVCKIVCNAICELKDNYIMFPDAAAQAIWRSSSMNMVNSLELLAMFP